MSDHAEVSARDSESFNRQGPQITIDQDEYDALQRERESAARRAEKARKEAEERAKKYPKTHLMHLASGRYQMGDAVTSHYSYVDDDGNDVIVPVTAAYEVD